MKGKILSPVVVNAAFGLVNVTVQVEVEPDWTETFSYAVAKEEITRKCAELKTADVSVGLEAVVKEKLNADLKTLKDLQAARKIQEKEFEINI